MNKHGMSVKELEKQRSAVRDKMNKRQEKLAVKTTAQKSHKPVSAAELKEGMHVRVLSMNVIGTILSAPNPKGEVTVGVGSLTTKTKINNLEIVTGYKDPEENDHNKNRRLKPHKDVKISFNLTGNQPFRTYR